MTTIYFLEIRDPAQHRIKPNTNANFIIKQQKTPDAKLNRYFYLTVGQHYQWTDRVNWSDQQWQDYVNLANLRTFVAYLNDQAVGYFELQIEAIADTTNSRASIITDTSPYDIQIAYFGLLPNFIGQQLGGPLLSFAINESFNLLGRKANRVWLHTCSLDHPNALANYQARGFKIFDRKQDSADQNSNSKDH